MMKLTFFLSPLARARTSILLGLTHQFLARPILAHNLALHRDFNGVGYGVIDQVSHFVRRPVYNSRRNSRLHTDGTMQDKLRVRNFARLSIISQEIVHVVM